ncbi:hypothetical protein QBC41DRAFT_207163, partial [Cercophora samala]
NVLYILLYIYKDSDFYPGKSENPIILNNSIKYYKTKNKFKKNINIAIIIPINYKFNFNLVLISVSFNAIIKNKLGAYFISPGYYAYITSILISLINKKVAVYLKGGYNLFTI